MTTEIEGVWRHGRIVPLDNVDLEEETKVLISVVAEKKVKLPELAGAWKDYRTKDGKTLDDVKKEIYDSRKISTRGAAVL